MQNLEGFAFHISICELSLTCSKSCAEARAEPHRCHILEGGRGRPHPGGGQPQRLSDQALRLFEKHRSHEGLDPTEIPSKTHGSGERWWLSAHASSRTTGGDWARGWRCRVLDRFLTASKPNQRLRDHHLMNYTKSCIRESPYPGWVRTPLVLYLGVITLHEHVNH